MNRERLLEIEARIAAIDEEVTTRGAELTEAEIAAFDAELTELRAEEAELTTAAAPANEQRAALLARLNEGRAGAVARNFNTPGQQAAPAADPNDTPQYRNAFMEFVCRGAAIPAELRPAIPFEFRAVTTVADAGAVIPTTTLQEIIRKLESYGGIYAKVRKLNIQGGVRVPILTLKPTATWVGEGASEDQKIQVNTYVEFSYIGLECKIAQTLLASVVTYEMFQREFVKLAVEAIIKALEKAIFTGTGSGQALGLTVDSRVPTANTITMSPEDFQSWQGWKRQVFAKMKKSYRNGLFAMAQGTFDGYIDGMVDETGQPIARVNYGIADGEVYRFGGKAVETVEDDIIIGYDEAAEGDVVAVFFNPQDYAINSNMQMTVVKWTDHDDNLVKNKAIIICDGKLLDPNGVLIIKKGGAVTGGGTGG